MKKRWFGRLNKGIGWYPVTWQGWVIFIVYVLAVIWDFLRIQSTSSGSLTYIFFPFLPEFLIFTFILAFICFITGEKPNT